MEYEGDRKGVLAMELSEKDITFLLSAVALAQESEEAGNLPVGTVISLQGEIIGRGRNAVWEPTYRPDRHSEMEALRSVNYKYWKYAPDMKLFTTLEPCLMCLGAILVHHIGYVCFGSANPDRGAGVYTIHLPSVFADRFTELEWVGPALPEMCDPLFNRLKELENLKGSHIPKPRYLKDG